MIPRGPRVFQSESAFHTSQRTVVRDLLRNKMVEEQTVSYYLANCGKIRPRPGAV